MERRIGARLPPGALTMRWSETTGRFPRRAVIDRRARILNVSMSGALVETDPDVKLVLGAPLPVTIDDIPVGVRVVRRETGLDGGGDHYGVLFESLPDELRQLVNDRYPSADDAELLDFWLSAR